MSDANRLDQKQLEQIPLEQIDRSRKNRAIDEDEPELLEMAQSIKEHGVLQPVLLQPVKPIRGGQAIQGVRYQLVAGERRWRAAKIAGLSAIPAIVLASMSEVDAYQLTLIENLQRKNLTPLEEAEEYQKLLQSGSTPAAIAARIGKSVRYVYDRSRLLSLITEAQELLRAGKMDAGHAVLLARISPAQQKDALRRGLFDREQMELLPGQRDDYQSMKPRTVQELSSWINRHVRFTEPDPMLFPETAETLAKAKEEAAKVVSITHTHFVEPEAKDGTRIFGPHSWKRADGTGEEKGCDRSVIGVIVAGPGRGQAFPVCIDKKKCLVHWGKEIRARQKAEKGTATSANKAEDRYAEQRAKDAERQKLDEAKRLRFSRARAKVRGALAERVKKAPLKAGSYLAAMLMESCHVEAGSTSLVALGKTSDEMLRALAFGIIFQHTKYDYGAGEFAAKCGKALGVDVQKVIDENEKALATKPPGKKKAKG